MAKKKKTKVVDRESNESVRTVKQLKNAKEYRIRLKGVDVDRVFEAKTEHGAWAKYKKFMGIRYTDHEPKITRCPKNVEWDKDTHMVTNRGAAVDPKKEKESLEPEDDDADFDTVPYEDSDDFDEDEE